MPIPEKPDRPLLRALTLDAGGTLIKPHPSVGHVYAAVARRLGVSVPDETLNLRFGEAWRGRHPFAYSHRDWHRIVSATFDPWIPPLDADTVFRLAYEAFAEPGAWHVFPDVAAVLRLARHRRLRIALVSNWDERLEPLLDRLGLLHHFDAAAVSGPLGCHKPEPAIFLHAARSLGVPPSAILHLGDSPVEDLEGARAAGFRAGLVDRRRHPRSAMLRALRRGLRSH